MTCPSFLLLGALSSRRERKRDSECGVCAAQGEEEERECGGLCRAREGDRERVLSVLEIGLAGPEQREKAREQSSGAVHVVERERDRIRQRRCRRQSCRNMKIVGLTGGIGSGKSTASKEFQAFGVPIIDADKVAHAALKKGTLAWRRVVAAFGEGVLQENGEVDRARLGEIIFSDPAKRKVLNSAMSFSIAVGLYWELIKHWIKGTRVVIMDVPLLFESGLSRLTKPIIVVWVDSETQEERLMKRDQISREQAHKKISSQLPLDQKRDQADLVIDNSGTLDVLQAQASTIHAEIMGPSTKKELALSRNGVLALVVAALSLWFLVK